jgi:exopolysaccharide biosynthesis polyprenyl glycosylphosphotransferase
MTAGSIVRARLRSTPQSSASSFRGRLGQSGLLVLTDWLCAVAASLALFPADVRWPAVSLMPLAWVCTTGMYRLYEQRHLGSGSEEFRRVVRAAFAATAAASAFFALLIGSDRELRSVLLMVPGAGLLSILVRQLVRAAAGRPGGTVTRRALLVGTPAQTRELGAVLRRNAKGIEPVGVCLTLTPDVSPLALGELPVLGFLPSSADLDGLAIAVEAATAYGGCDTVVLLPGAHLTVAGLHRLAWLLHDRDVELLVAPLLGDIAARRVTLRHDSGVSLLHVRAPELSRVARIPKEMAERIGAVAGMILLSPLFAVIALAILWTEGRPVFFRQVRIGLRGQPFTLTKFRTMGTDAEAGKAQFAHLNVNDDGLLFKLRDDPRVTRVGRFLRRFSLDELPQLLNVAAGSMSLIGPRPPLPEEAAAYTDEIRRRLLVKPGLTGLWQVSGRSDLPWEEALRLDLGYVENWSLALDASILLRTGSAVLKGTGAY